MELPIDHFRLLGVSPTTDGQSVLRTLQQRLDRAPDQGFTHDTLQARAELLRSSAELLSDEERRQHYERELTRIADDEAAAVAGLEIPPSREVGGLLLLMEAGQAQEAFDAASRGLQPPQAPALGSSREADLTLLAGLACQAAAADYRNQRHYETAARTLQQGLQLLQRMGQLPEQRRRLEQELQALQPYRVLDLISRDLSALAPRQEGIALLHQLVQRRGGLEGDADPDFPAADFQAFFEQIRPFLTAQEQVDLFSRWAEGGSGRADRLTSLALTATGFVQRKPERIQAALQRLQATEPAAMATAMACQQLLLGQVEQARSLIGAAPAAASQPGGEDPLAQLCSTCRDWLHADVLPGFRDIDAEADLEAWFADRDVQAYIEQQDRIRGRQAASVAAPSQDSWSGADSFTPAAFSPLGASAMAMEDVDGDDGEEPDEHEALWDGPPFWERWQLAERLADWREHLPQHWPRWSAPAGAALAVAVLGGLVWVGLRPGRQPAQPIPVEPSPPAAPAAPAAPVVPAPVSRELPLTVPEPSEAQLQTLLSAWLEAKAAVLAGKPAAEPLSDLARPLLISRLEQQQQQNRSRNTIEAVEATIQSLKVQERSPQRIAAAVSLRYSDEQRDADGRVLSRTPSRELRNVYVFARDGATWHVAAFRPSR
ncbi:MAG: IMS domain-containing protein [Vulcanococcus sp.]